jgi:hypothetical protein
MLVASHEIHNFVAICHNDDMISKREGEWVQAYSRTPIIRLQPFGCYCALCIYQPAHFPFSIDWHAAIEKTEVLEKFAGYHPGLLAVVK